MSRADTFRSQQARLANLKKRPRLFEAAPTSEVGALISAPVDDGYLAAMDYRAGMLASLEVEEQNPHAILADLEKAFDDKRVDELLGKIQKDVLSAVVVPFGLGKILSLSDKHGGNVDTIHNARAGVYATEREREAYENRGEYNTYAVHSDSKYIETNRQISSARKGDGITDDYSGKNLTQKDHVDLDHVISGKQTHDDPGRALAGVPTEDLANISENLTPTDRSINRSKKAFSPEKFAQRLEAKKIESQKRISDLSQREGSLTDKERKELNKLRKLDEVDLTTLCDKGKKAAAAQDSKLNKEYYGGKKFAGDALKTSLNEAGKMGTQQAIGLMLTEFFDGVITEARDLFHNGLTGQSLFNDLSVRFNRVAKKVTARWKDAVGAFFEGSLAGFFSNLVTTLINAFVTTGKRAVRMIREGVFSLFKAVKMVLSPPEGMTAREACHEGIKLLTAGGILVGGILLEEAIAKIVGGIPFASTLVAVIVGATTALAMALAAYLIDKMDLLSVIRKQRNEFVVRELNDGNAMRLEECHRLADELDKWLPEPCTAPL